MTADQIGGSRSLSAATFDNLLGEVPSLRAVWPVTAAGLPAGSHLAVPAIQAAGYAAGRVRVEAACPLVAHRGSRVGAGGGFPGIFMPRMNDSLAASTAPVPPSRTPSRLGLLRRSRERPQGRHQQPPG